MEGFGGVSRRDSGLREEVVRRTKRRRQRQAVQEERCESGARVDGGPENTSTSQASQAANKDGGQTTRSRLELGVHGQSS